MNRLRALVVTASCACAPTALPTSAPRADCSDADAVDVVDHAIDLQLAFDPPSLAGRGVIRVVARREAHAVVLDAHALQISEVASDAGALHFTHTDGRLCVDLPRPMAAGVTTSLHIAWNAAVDRSTPRFAGAQVWAGYDAAAWMPTRHDPAQRATLALRLTAPSVASVTASGRLVSRTPRDDGTTTHSFAIDRPSPPFLYAFAAGRFAAAELDVDGVTLRALGPPHANLAGALAITAPMLRFLRDHVGPPPSNEYTQVFVKGDAAQEAAGFALLSANALEDVRNDPTEDWIFSHELAHQWFAWLVPCADFADFWLNEGFATFLTAAIKEERWGRAAYERELRLWCQRSAKVHADGRDAPLSLSSPSAPARRPPREAELQARGVTYARGALVLHKLRTELGDAVFWAGVRRYVSDRAGKSARTEDLRRAFEAASGRDLRGFFDRWVYAAAADL